MHYNSHYNDTPQVEGDVPPDLTAGKGKRNMVACRDVPDNAYFDGRIAELSINALRELKQKEQPFFLAVGFWKPHLPFNAPKKYWDWYKREEVPVPTHLEPPVDVPEIALTKFRYDGRKKPDELRELHHGHLAAISYLDTQVGKVLGELDRLGLRENTIVVFWSDHGLHIGEHGLIRKTTAFELDAGVPMVIASPKHRGGRQTDALVELLDIYPTLAELCGLPTPKVLEGVSLVPLLNDPTASVKLVALTQAPRPAYLKGKMPETGNEKHGGAVREGPNRKAVGRIVAGYPGSTAMNMKWITRMVIAAALLVSLASLAGQPLRQARDRPNIVLIMADDLGYGDVGCYGSALNETPHIDALAASGLRFTDFHSSGAMCSPTRAAMLTGQYQQRFGSKFDTALSGIRDVDSGLPLEAATLAEGVIRHPRCRQRSAA